MSATESTLSNDEIKAKCRLVIDRFAHRDVLREEDIRDWLNHVVGVHGEQAVWHATRASGFGGSDIGVLVRNYQGFRADHQVSAHDLVTSKLLRSVPSDETGDLRRGHDNEEPHALRYYAKYGAVRDVEAYNGLTHSTGQRRWMRYSPDDVVLMPSDTPNPHLGGRFLSRLLIDYKAPRVVEQDDSIHFQYSCQLHMGAMICAKNKIHLDGLQLTQFDWANWQLKDDYVEYDPELAKLILAAGDHYHGMVLRGEIPDYIRTPKFSEQEKLAEQFGSKAQKLAHLLALGKAVEKEAEFLGDELKSSIKASNGEAGASMAGTEIKLGDLTVSCVLLLDHEAVSKALSPEEIAAARKNKKSGKEVTWDAEAMAAELQRLGGDPTKFRTDKCDQEKAFDALLAKGLDAQTFMKESVRLKTSKFLTEEAAKLVKKLYPRDDAPPVEVEGQEQIEADAAAVSQEIMAQVLQLEAPDVAAEVQDEGESDVRDGQSTERLAQRTVSA